MYLFIPLGLISAADVHMGAQVWGHHGGTEELSVNLLVPKQPSTASQLGVWLAVS